MDRNDRSNFKVNVMITGTEMFPFKNIVYGKRNIRI